MKIGIDMDNVICDTGRYLIDKIKEYDKNQNRLTKKEKNVKQFTKCLGMIKMKKSDSIKYICL